MPAMTLIYALVLVLIGVIGYVATGAESWTALIPAIVGLLAGVCGILALAKPEWRKHVMHAAVLIALLAFLAMFDPLRRGPDTAVLTSALLTMAASLAYLVLAVRSFIAARRARENGSDNA